MARRVAVPTADRAVRPTGDLEARALTQPPPILSGRTFDGPRHPQHMKSGGPTLIPHAPPTPLRDRETTTSGTLPDVGPYIASSVRRPAHGFYAAAQASPPVHRNQI